MTPSQKALYEAAKKARENSYSPYSGHKVGAAIQVVSEKDGTRAIFGGCNIENSSYGGANCAERVAIHKAVSELGRVRIEEIVVITDAEHPWPPCGFCRQVISEFSGADTPIHAANLSGKMRSSTFGQLFPEAFTPDYLKK